MAAAAKPPRPPGRRPKGRLMSRRHLAMLITLGALWGASFMFIKVGDRELEPITLVGFRMALGALTLVPIRFIHSERVTGSRLAGLFVGFAVVALLVGGHPGRDIVAGLDVVSSA